MKHDPNTPPEVSERRERVQRVLKSEISVLLEDVYRQDQETGGNEAKEIAGLISSFSGLMARLGKEAESQTKSIVYLTWALVGLTFALLVLTAIMLHKG